VRRREFLIAAAAFVALPVHSQSRATLRRIAVVTIGDRERFRPQLDSLLAGLREHGYVEGKTVELDVRYANAVQAEIPKLLREALAAKPEIVVVGGIVNAKLAKQTTTTVPIVVYVMSDPVEAGLVASFARPGGNVTGLADLADETTLKRLEFAAAAVPKAQRLLLFLDPAFPATKRIEARLNDAATALRLRIDPVYVTDRAAIEKALATLDKSRNEVLVAGPSSVLVQNAKLLIEGAVALGVPVVHFWTGTAEQGALLSHGVNIHQNLRRTGFYVDRILKGARPGELPIEQPSRYELILNLKTAKQLGITVPQAFLARVDQVIE
jgi:putative ABC transport system substrate-binding protein